MRKYVLETPRDDHGQPIRPRRINIENNVSKAIDQLSGICAGILADGYVSDEEAKFFLEWVRRYAAYESVWPFTDIIARISRIPPDGKLDEDERRELRDIMLTITGQTTDVPSLDETYSSRLPLDEPPPASVILFERHFVITGRFAYGTRAKVIEAIESRGGIAHHKFPSRETHYLVIGAFASRDWYYTNYGQKIARAVELRHEGTGIAIISEEHWNRFLA